jgi:hypothetical protein
VQVILIRAGALSTGPRRIRMVLGIIAAGAVLLVAPPARACSCIQVSPEHAFANADRVFAGRMIARRSLDPPRPPVEAGGLHVLQPADGAEFTFAVTNVWKGAVEETIRVRSAGFGGGCGYNFPSGTHHLVYASERWGALWTGLCTRNAEIRHAIWDRLWLPNARVLRADHAVTRLTTEEVLELLNGSDPDLRYRAGEALGGSPGIRGAVLPVLRDLVRGRRPGDPSAAARALGWMSGGGRAAEDDLGWLLAHGSGGERASALAALVRVCGSGSSRYILAALSDPTPECLEQACREAPRLSRADSLEFGQPAAQRLARLVEHPNAQVRAQAILALGSYPSTGIALLPRFETLAQFDPDGYVRYAARQTTRQLSGRKLPFH